MGKWQGMLLSISKKIYGVTALLFYKKSSYGLFVTQRQQRRGMIN